MKVEKWITVDPKTSAWLDGLLAREPACESDCCGEDESFTKTVVFDDGYEMDVRLCGVRYREGESNLPWTEAVLFRNGCEVCCSEPGEEYFGRWELSDGDRHFVVNVARAGRQPGNAPRVPQNSSAVRNAEEGAEEMYLLQRVDTTGVNGTTVYCVGTKSREMTVVRHHYPLLTENMVRIDCSECSQAEQKAVLDFLKVLFPIDFATPVIYIKHRLGHNAIQDACWSIEQAMFLAEKRWNDSRPEDWTFFCVKADGRVIKEWTRC